MCIIVCIIFISSGFYGSYSSENMEIILEEEKTHQFYSETKTVQ